MIIRIDKDYVILNGIAVTNTQKVLGTPSSLTYISEDQTVCAVVRPTSHVHTLQCSLRNIVNEHC